MNDQEKNERKNKGFYEVRENPEMVESALLVGIADIETSPSQALEHVEELGRLTDTMGVNVADKMVVRVAKPNPRYYVGSGKAEEIKTTAEAMGVDVLIFDQSLSPSQQRNWEKLSGLCVIDREEVILDIFAQRARTKEAVLQVGLARMEYHLPRLKRAWTHLERQRQARGARGGPGELQLEVDRRIVLKRIHKFKRELAVVRRQRAIQRSARGRRPVPTAAIVGYTNAGKSSLLKRLTGAEVFIEDKLFATLDTTTRRIGLEGNQPLLLTDTVGFIRKLPHHLVEAFQSTLEEAVEADFLLHVVDVTHPDAVEHYEVTEKVLDELGAQARKTFLVLNKIDGEYDPHMPVRLRSYNPECFEVSAHSGEGIDRLLEAMGRDFIIDQLRSVYCVPAARYDLVSLIHREGAVHNERHLGENVWLDATIPDNQSWRVSDFKAQAMPEEENES